MNCAHHPNVPAAALCTGCNRALCSTCANAYQSPLCSSCATTLLGKEKNNLITMAVVSVLLIAVPVVLFAGFPLWSRLFLGLWMACAPWGWRALSSITPKVFLWMPLVGWFFYFSLKWALSTFVGPFTAPVQIARAVRRWKEIDQSLKLECGT